MSEIAIKLNKSQSTISREIIRNTGGRGYRYKQAQKISRPSVLLLKSTGDCESNKNIWYWFFFAPYTEKRKEFLADPEGLRKILATGAEKARYIANKTLRKVRKKGGLLY